MTRRWLTGRWPWRWPSGAVPCPACLHTDQGSEYTARSFRQACERLGIAQSMGQRGSALDNAVIESWHSTLEFELRSLQSSRRGRRRELRSPRGSRITTTSAGTPRSACAVPWITSGCWRERTPRDRGGPAARAGKGGGCAAAVLAAPAWYGAATPASRVLSHRPAGDGPSGRPGPRGPLRPLGAGKAGRPQPCPGRTRAQQGQPVPAGITKTMSPRFQGNRAGASHGADQIGGSARWLRTGPSH